MRVADIRTPVTESRTLGLESHPQFDELHDEDEQLEQDEDEQLEQLEHDDDERRS
jgi:hypothetical protein